MNLAGEVVGISCMKAVAADGVSFAIPVDTAVDVMQQLRLHGRVIRPYIGIKCARQSAVADWIVWRACCWCAGDAAHLGAPL